VFQVVMSTSAQHEKLFAELVASSLRERMDSDWAGHHFDLPDAISDRVAVLENSLVDLKYDVASIKDSVQFIANALGVRSSQSHQSQFVAPTVTPSALIVPAQASLSPDSSPASPGSSGYAFRCPICTKPQYSPKSHCGHMRRLADGNGYCSLRQDVGFHAGIVRCHGSVSQFVTWYTKRLRSSVGSHYTDADITDYEQTQLQLRHDVETGVIYSA
jgi:hypothetical protein